MFKLPQDLEDLQSFAEYVGSTCARALSIEDRESLDLTQIANNFFDSYELQCKEPYEPFCNDLEEGREVFTHFFEKGFVIFHSDKLY